MKTLNISDIERIPAQDVKPGSVTAQGIVLHVDVSKRSDVVWFTYASDLRSHADLGQPIQVIAKVSQTVLENLRQSAAGIL